MTGAVNNIEIVTKGSNAAGGIQTTCTLYSMAKSTGVETNMGGVTNTGSASVHTNIGLLITNTFDFQNNFHYVRCTITSGAQVSQTQTLYGVTLNFI